MLRKLNDKLPLSAMKTLKINHLFLSTLLFLPLFSYSQVQLGMKAPEIHPEGTYNCGNISLQPESLKGKIVVLDFWATWCSPCVAAFPENNELSAKYKDKGVVFIAITDDPKEKLENFLKKVKIDFCVGRDDDQQDFKNYSVTGRPAMFIINRDGILVYRGNHLTEETLLEVVNTNGIAPEQKSSRPEVILNGGFRGGEDPLYNGMKMMTGNTQSCTPELIDQLIIRPSLETNSTGSFGYRMKQDHVGITYSSGTLEDIFVFLHDLPSTVWIANMVNDSCRYDVIYWRKNDSFEKAVSEIEHALTSGLSITFDSISEKRPVTVLSLNKSNGSVISPEQLEEGTDKAYTSIGNFLTKLEELTNQFYLADDSLKDKLIHNQGMEWKKLHDANPAEIIDFLKTRGIVLKQETRAITTYIIRKN
ncbi:peroxiredoxin family protein [Fluviicola chungangensis]|uniref:TlpA family protein disulfide reductase n=1 Tax=Fluviicola chungangensis TaxID=2597671 RepID=A0A556MNT1_9FLAO|nr:TlpA disulfide reductase family protein [Fluviicola chungangensis]TSJ41593.1 TlpA family protein disulfide reductase [Fluviicola chungangensis]